MSEKIALIGAGVTGGAVGTRLLETGNSLKVFDLDPDKVAILVAKGGVAATSAAEASRDVDFVITSLNASHIVKRVAFGDGGIAEGAAVGTVIINMSSIASDMTRQLAQMAKGRGLAWVDSPLSGGAPKALMGDLTLMAGGEAADVERANRALKHVASNYTHMGPPGAGQTTKLINQVLCGLNFMAVAEATQLAMDAAVDALKIPQALKGGRADPVLLQEYLPRFATKDYRRTDRIDNMVKDLNAVNDLARQTGTSMPMTALCAEIHRMLTAAGLGGEDQAAVMEYFKGAREDIAS